MIGRGVRIGGIVRRQGLDRRHRGGDQLLGTSDVGLAAGASRSP
jgi:hypothetical protein